jgi:hypothetical protein
MEDGNDAEFSDRARGRRRLGLLAVKKTRTTTTTNTTVSQGKPWAMLFRPLWATDSKCPNASDLVH